MIMFFICISEKKKCFSEVLFKTLAEKPSKESKGTCIQRERRKKLLSVGFKRSLDYRLDVFSCDGV